MIWQYEKIWTEVAKIQSHFRGAAVQLCGYDRPIRAPMFLSCFCALLNKKIQVLPFY